MVKIIPDNSGEAGPAALAALVSLPFQIRRTQITGKRAHYPGEGSGPSLLLASAGQWPERFRALMISNTFGWPLAGYPAVQRTLRVIASPLFGVISGLANAAALVTASSYGVGRKNDPYGWQSRFAQISSHTTASGITAGCHFPFNDDPDAYAAAISAWRADKVAASGDNSANLSRS